MKSEGQKNSQSEEKRLANKVGGSVRPGSGAFATAKGDVRQNRAEDGSSYASLLIEHKWTGKQQIVIKAHVLEKITMESLLEGRMPALGLSLNGHNYVVMNEDDVVEMVSAFARIRSQHGVGEEGQVPGA